MAKYCSKCGKTLGGTEKFCGNCGAKIRAPILAPETRKPAGKPVRKEEKTENKEKTEDELRAQQRRQQLRQRRIQQYLHTQEIQTPKTADVQERNRSETSGIGSFYIVSFVKNLFRVGNIPTLLYLFLNLIFIVFIVSGWTKGNLAEAVGISVVLYAISVCIALSPIGEFILRYESGCKPIKDIQIQARLHPIFVEVYKKAKEMDPALPDNIKFYMNEETCPNAFAIGRKTVCVTKGLLDMSDRQIAAILGHEFGHLSHHDTDAVLLITVGNLFVNVVMTIVRIVINLVLLIAAMFVESWFGAMMHRGASIGCAISLSIFMYLWSRIGVLLVMKSSRMKEFEADLFSAQLGYGKELANALYILAGGSSRPQGVFAALAASHPPTKQRIQRIIGYVQGGQQ